MSVVINLVLLVIILLMLIFVEKLVAEAVKLQNNPIPRMQNHDKRFFEIKNEYLHEMYKVKLR